MIGKPDRWDDVRRREFEARVLMGEPPARAASSIPLRERDTDRRRRITREFLRRYCFGFGSVWRG
jgi:hypothetical protein